MKIRKMLTALAVLCQIGAVGLAADTTMPAQTTPEKAIQFAGKGPGHPVIDKSQDAQLQKLIGENKAKFKQFSYVDHETGKSISYNLYTPAEYRPDKPYPKAYPMVVFIADASTVGADMTAPLTQGYGGVIWASKAEQKKHPCLVLVPHYKDVAIDDHNGFKVSDEVEVTAKLIKSVAAQYGVDEKRIYGTGQSMGCMITMYLAAKHPDLYAAELLVSGQWDVNELKPLGGQKFFYVAAAGDEKASTGQRELLPVLQAEGVKVGTLELNAKDSLKQLSQQVRKEGSQKQKIHFATFTLGSVLPAGIPVGTSEHMYSFDHAYQIEALRDWLFKQHK